VGLRRKKGQEVEVDRTGGVRIWERRREHARCRRTGSKWMDDVDLALIRTAKTQPVVRHGPVRKRLFRIAQSVV
jgi:hypothetical protein